MEILEAERLLRSDAEGITRWNELMRSGDARKDLAGIDLQGASLRSADLRRVDLSGASLAGANLARADLQGACLLDCDLAGADLKWVRIGGTFLKYDRSSGQSSILPESLRGARFEHALLGFSTFMGSLCGAIGLDKVLRRGGSQLTCEALLSLEAPLPEAFLRACSVPEELLVFARARMAN